MNLSTIMCKSPSEIRAAMALALLQLKLSEKLTLEEIGHVIGRGRESVSQYIADEAEMGATCWLRAVAQWPELADRLEHNLDEAEKAFLARQRSLNLRDAA